MTEIDRKEIEAQIIWARLKLSTEEFESWRYQKLKPSSDEFPEGLFYSRSDWYNYFGIEKD